MTFTESYQKYLVLAQANGTTDKLSTNRARYAVKYNIAQNKIVEWFIENNGTDENRYIQILKKPYKPLEKVSEKDLYTEFKIPEDYFEFIDLISYGSNSNCKDQVLQTKEVKGENVSNLLRDPFSDPSFKYRETVYTISDNKVQVYKKDFDITKTEMSYYRYPIQVELQNPDNPESKFKDISHDFDDKLVNRIILMTVSLHKLSSDDPAFQAFKQETIQKY